MRTSTKKFLKFLEITRSQFWNISPETGFFLYNLIKNSDIKTILEIGTSNGVSAIYMAEALRENKKGHLYTIESNYRFRFPLATENFRKARLTKHVTQILGHAPDVIPPKPQKFDLIFLDATKYEHPLYLDAILHRLSKNGIIITDNAISHKKELTPYFKKISKLKNFESHLLSIGSGLLVSTLNS